MTGVDSGSVGPGLPTDSIGDRCSGGDGVGTGNSGGVAETDGVRVSPTRRRFRGRDSVGVDGAVC